jgi:hypothetical protein
MKIDRKELHRRLARRWRISAELNQKGAAYVRRALEAHPREDTIEDLQFLDTSFRVLEPLMEALAEYHSGLVGYFSSSSDEAKARLDAALAKAAEAQTAEAAAFPHIVDPVGGDVGAVRHYTGMLIKAIAGMRDGL